MRAFIDTEKETITIKEGHSTLLEVEYEKNTPEQWWKIGNDEILLRNYEGEYDVFFYEGFDYKQLKRELL